MASLQSQMRRRDVEMVPRILVRSMFGAMLAALALTTFAVMTDRPLVGVAAPSPVVSEIEVRLLNDGRGLVTVVDPSGAVLARSDEDRAGFIGVMQSAIARERLRRGLADEAPVRVLRHADGRIEVIDATTGWSVDLVGNGRDNVAAFARLMP